MSHGSWVVSMQCFLGLGANIGEPLLQLASAIAALAAIPGIRVTRASSVYTTTPVGYSDQPDFLNMVIAVEAALHPERLLDVTQGIENRLGRVRAVANGPRTIDIDILLCDDIQTQIPELTLPHPRIRERQFVLVPLCQIAPDLLLPDGTPVARLRATEPEGVTCRGKLAELIRRSRESRSLRGTEGF